MVIKMNKKRDPKKREVNSVAEKLLVDYELRNRAKDNLDKTSHNLQKMETKIDQQISMKKELLKDLKARRNSTHKSSKIKSDFINQYIRSKLKSAQTYTNKEMNLLNINKVNTIDIDRDDFDSDKYNIEFARQENINIDSPFLNLYSKNEQVRVAEQMIQKFDLLKLDSYDYMFATGAGLIAGFIDTFFVGTIAKGKDAKGLQKFVDNRAEGLVKRYALKEKIADLENKKKNAKSSKGVKEIEQTINDLKNGKRKFDAKSSIRYLEKNHKVGYDAATSKHIKGMSPDNHHLLSIAHEPSLLGLIIGIYNQLTGTATYMSKEGKIINTIAENENIELTGNLPNQIIQATQNWFGHIMSDISGSSTSKGRGSGLPVPGWSSLQKLQFGNICVNNKEMNIAQVSEWMFKNGYDFRAFTAELIPVVIYETLIRLYWVYKQHFYFGKPIKESLPIANNRELARLLLIGASTFSAVDVTHGIIKSATKNGVQPQGIATFIMTVNKPGLIDLGFRSYQNIRLQLKHRKHVDHVIEEDIKQEYKRVMENSDIFG
ncbi:ATP-binding protein [Staphylococcus pettenkoferi]|nr:ATP-binding protein [Staphylococcus pettenkoferi]